jgi:hypothetical protein
MLGQTGMTSHDDHSTRNPPFGRVRDCAGAVSRNDCDRPQWQLCRNVERHMIWIMHCIARLERYRYNPVMDQPAAENGFQASMPNTSCILDSSQAHCPRRD